MKLLTPAAVAEQLGVHVQTVYRNGAIPGRVKVGRLTRFKATEVEKFIEARTIPRRNLPPRHDIIVLGGGEGMPKGKRQVYYSFGYGGIIVRRRKDGTARFYLDYRADGRRQREVVPWASCVEDAVAALKERLVLGDNKRMSFCGWAERYKATHLPHLKKPKTEEQRLDNLKAWFTVDDLRKITPTMVDEFRAWRLRKKNTRATVNRYVALLKTMLNRAVDEGYLEANPCRKIKQYSERDREHMRILTLDEEPRLMAELAPHIRPIVVIALNTGLRLGEIMRLKWSDVDMGKALLKIENTKSGKVRYVPTNERVLGILGGIPRKGRNIFQILNPKTGFYAALRRAGIAGVRFHDLRHTFASRLVLRGADIETIRSLLGHSSLSVTQKYVHSGRDDARQAVESLPVLSHLGPTEKSKELNLASKSVN